MTAKAILATLATLVWASAAAAEPVGFVAAVRGLAEVRPAGDTLFTLARVDRDVSEGDAVRTGRDGWAKLLLRDDTTLAVDEETELVLDHYVLGNLSAQQEPSRIELLSGRLRTKVAEVFGDRTRLEIVTPTAVIGVKGTEWLTWLLDDSTWVCVIRGVVSAAQRDTGVGGEIDLGPGQCARIGRRAAPERVPEPEHLRPLAMRPGLVPDDDGFPAKLDPTRQPDPTLIDVNDTRPEIERPEPPPPPPAPLEPDPPPTRGGNPFGGPPVAVP